MFGRNGAKSRPARSTRADAARRGTPDTTATGRVSGNIETDSLVISQGGFFNGNVTKMREPDAHAGPRPVHLVEDMRQGAQK